MKLPTRIFESRLVVAIVAAVAAVLLFGGGAAVAFNVPNNSVTSAKIVDGAVRSVDIRNGSIQRIDLAGAVQTRFARVAYSGGVPVITAQSGGLSIVDEPFSGAVRIDFPRNMDNCAITATAYTSGATTSIRRSSVGGADKVVVVGFDEAGTTVETPFDLMAQC